MAIVAIGIAALAVAQMSREASLSAANPRAALLVALAVAMAYYGYVGIGRVLDREPQVTIDRDGIVLGFGRNRRLAWEDIEWVRLRRLAVRAQLQIGLVPEAFVAADLKLSVWALDDGLKPIAGMPAAVLVRDNGLDTTAAAMLDAIRAFRPNLVKL